MALLCFQGIEMVRPATEYLSSSLCIFVYQLVDNALISCSDSKHKLWKEQVRVTKCRSRNLRVMVLPIWRVLVPDTIYQQCHLYNREYPQGFRRVFFPRHKISGVGRAPRFCDQLWQCRNNNALLFAKEAHQICLGPFEQIAAFVDAKALYLGSRDLTHTRIFRWCFSILQGNTGRGLITVRPLGFLHTETIWPKIYYNSPGWSGRLGTS